MKRGITLLFLFISLVSFAQMQISSVQRRILLDLADDLEIKHAKARTFALEKANREGWIVRAENRNHIIELDRIDPETGIPIYFVTESNLNAANTMGTQKLWPGGTFGLNLTGTGMNVGEWDGGAILGIHQELIGRVTQVDGATTTSSHSTHVAGTILASGLVSTAKGMAYQANLQAYDWNSDGPEMATAAANGLLLSNHSYGYITGWYYNFSDSYWYWFGDTSKSATTDARFGYYDNYAQSWDQIAFNAPNYLIVKSAGNDRGEGPGAGTTHKVNRNGNWVLSTVTRDKDGGTTGYDCISSNSLSKNILTIGAVNIIASGYTIPSSVVMSSFSGWGPTDDGRIKPDVVSPGVSLYSCDHTSNTAYTTKSGTSMASPAATGSLLLVQQHANNVRGSYLKAATLKGLTIHTADESGTTTGPDYKFGWGLINTSKAAELITNANFQNLIRENTLTNGSVQYLRVYSDGSIPLKATICWTDPASTPGTFVLNDRTPKLINDLDLRVYREGTVDSVFPYRLDPANPANAATNGDNVVDNVEQVLVANPTAGYYVIRVSHKRNLQNNAAQNYSLLVSGGNANTLALSNIPSFFAQGSNYSLLLSKTGSFASNNNFVVEFVPRGGGVAMPANTVAISGTDSLQISIPSGLSQGTNYDIRVRSTNPITYSTNTPVGITYLQQPVITSTKTSACNQDTFTVSTPNQTGVTFDWFQNGIAIGQGPSIVSTGPGVVQVRATDLYTQKFSSQFVISPKSTSPSFAGPNQIGLKTTQVQLNASTPAPGEKGRWRKSSSSTSTGNFVNDTVRNTTFYGVLGGIYDLIWQHQGDCGNIDDTVRIEIDSCTSVSSSISASICLGNSYSFNGQNYATSGIYLDTLVSSLGCDSIVALTLNVNVPSTNAIFESICSGSSFAFGSRNLTIAGVYRDTLSNALGCDSIVVLTLNVNAPPTSSISASICSGASYAFGSRNLTSAGVYRDTLSNVLGCDSVIELTLNVNVLPSISVQSYGATSLCRGDSVTLSASGASNYVWSNSATTSSINVNQSGNYSVIGIDSNGCSASSSVTSVIVNEPVVPTISATGNTSVCNTNVIINSTSASSYLWSNGDTAQSIVATVSGQYSVTTIDVNGCQGTSNVITINIYTAVPVRPVAITGNLNPCSVIGTSKTLTYSVPADPNASSFIWTLFSGITAVGNTTGNVISVTYPLGFTSGQIRVTPVNTCGSGTARAIYPKTVAITTVPSFTQATYGVCGIRGTSNAATYSIQPISGCSSYTWTLPANTTLVSGQGTTSIRVTFSSAFTTGTISVVGVSPGCGNTPSISVAIGLTEAPIISGPNTICPGDQATYTVAVTDPSINRVRYNLPAGLALVSQVGFTAVITNTGSFISGKITANNFSTICGWSKPSSISISTASCRANLGGVSVNIYPNPSHGEFQIQLGGPVKNVQVSLYAADGRLVKRQVFGQVQNQTLNYNDLAEGLYHLEILATDEENNLKRWMEKVVIQH